MNDGAPHGVQTCSHQFVRCSGVRIKVDMLRRDRLSRGAVRLRKRGHAQIVCSVASVLRDDLLPSMFFIVIVVTARLAK
jgi:hypothetical protein